MRMPNTELSEGLEAGDHCEAQRPAGGLAEEVSEDLEEKGPARRTSRVRGLREEGEVPADSARVVNRDLMPVPAWCSQWQRGTARTTHEARRDTFSYGLGVSTSIAFCTAGSAFSVTSSHPEIGTSMSGVIPRPNHPGSLRSGSR
jgi:hypothetical protein